MPYLINALLAINVTVCLLIILLVLMQRPRNEGLGAAFGGGVTEGLFGTQTTHVLARATRWLGGIFFALTLGLGLLYSRNFGTHKSPVERHLTEAPVPVATPVAATPAPGTPAPAAAPALPDGTPVPALESPAPVPGASTPAAPSSAVPAPAAPDSGATPIPSTPPPAGGITPPVTPEAPAPAPAATTETPAPAAPPK